MRLVTRLMACVVFAWLGGPSFCARAGETLAEKLMPLVEAHAGKVAIAVKQLNSGESFAHEADRPMPTASLIKLPVMVEAYRQAAEGKVELAELLPLREEDKVPGSGILTTHFSAGLQLPLRDAVRLMMAYSDNTATNLVVTKVGLANVNANMESLELLHTKIHSLVYRRDTSILPERSKEFGLGSTSASDMVRLLELLWNGKLADEAATKAMLAHLKACEDKRLSRHLPGKIAVYQKTGSVNAVRTVAGILDPTSGPVAICVLTSDNKDQRWTADNAGEVLCAKVGQIVFEHFQAAGQR
jgi:beta-lactamase class A